MRNRRTDSVDVRSGIKLDGEGVLMEGVVGVTSKGVEMLVGVEVLVVGWGVVVVGREDVVVLLLLEVVSVDVVLLLLEVGVGDDEEVVCTDVVLLEEVGAAVVVELLAASVVVLDDVMFEQALYPSRRMDVMDVFSSSPALHRMRLIPYHVIAWAHSFCKRLLCIQLQISPFNQTNLVVVRITHHSLVPARKEGKPDRIEHFSVATITVTAPCNARRPEMLRNFVGVHINQPENPFRCTTAGIHMSLTYQKMITIRSEGKPVSISVLVACNRQNAQFSNIHSTCCAPSHSCK